MITIIIMVLLSAIVSSTECDLSPDNLTNWTTITHTFFGGVINETDKTARVDFAEPDTNWYVRCQNDSTTWGYITVKTMEESFSDKMISIILALACIGLFFGFIGLSNTGMGIKLFGYGMALISIVNMAALLYLNETEGSLVGLLKINFLTLLILAFGMGMIGLIQLTVKMLSFGKNDDEGKWKDR